MIVALRAILFFFLLLLWTPAAHAHGDLHPRILAISKEIAASPTNGTLYFERGEMHRVHRDWTNAVADYDRAQQLNPSVKMIEFCRGRMWLEADQPKRALPHLDKYLSSVTNDSNAYATRARVQMQSGNARAAVHDFTRAIALAPVGNPELYIERADALRALGALEDAVRGLDEGIAKMGSLVTLQLRAIEVDCDLKRYDAALMRIDAVMARLQRKESWLVRRAEVLKLAGREKESREAYQAALAALEKLPTGHRNTRATLQLEASIRSALRADAGAPNPATASGK